jgi:DNA-directed RNA polymerase specialized sigma24 family protein
MGETTGTRARLSDPGPQSPARGDLGSIRRPLRPLIFQFARKQGPQDADAADLTRIVLQAVTGALKRLDYDPPRATFRYWLYKVVRN